jgi:hypothetical protein
MRTRLLGLLASTSLMLSTAAYAEPASVASALFRPVKMGIDAVLLAANLAEVDPAVVPDADQCEYDALNGRPEPAAVLSLEPAETVTVALDAKHQHEASVRNGDRDPIAHDETASALSQTEPVEATGSLSGSAMPGSEIGPDLGPDEVVRI